MALDRKEVTIISITILELIICFIFYPAWFSIPASRLIHYLIVAGLFIMICAFSLLLIYLNRKYDSKLKEKELSVDDLEKLEIKIKGKNISKYFIFGGFFLYSVFLLIIKTPALTSEFKIFGDEGFHVFRVILMGKMLTLGGILPKWVLAILLYMFLAMIITLVVLIRRKHELREKIKKMIDKRKKLIIWGTFVITVLIIASYTVLFDLLSLKAGFQLAEGNINIAFARYGPVSPIIGVIFLITFGYSEFWIHLISLLFSLLSMIYLYKLVRRYRSDLFAIFVSVLLPLLPTIFDFEGQYYLATGVLFFSIACIYHFHLAISKPDISELNKFLLIYVTGFLYKKVMIFTLGALYIYLSFIFIHKYLKSKQIKWNEVKLWGVYLVLALIPSFAWMLLTDSIVWRKYILSFSNLFSSHIFEYAKLVPQMMSFIWIIAIIGIPLSLIFLRDHLTYSSMLVSVVIYLIYTADSSWEVVEPRFMITILPLILICSMQMFDYAFLKGAKILIKKKAKFKTKVKQFLPVIWLLITIGFTIPLTIEGIKSDHESIETRVPFDSTALFLAENLTSDDSIVMLFGPNPIAFYAEKHDVTCEMYILREISSESYLIEFMENSSSSYFAVPDYDVVFNMLTEATYNTIFSETNFYLYHTITSINEKNIFILALY